MIERTTTYRITNKLFIDTNDSDDSVFDSLEVFEHRKRAASSFSQLEGHLLTKIVHYKVACFARHTLQPEKGSLMNVTIYGF